MPTMITVPVAQREKSIKFGAAYSPTLTFNPDKELLVGCSGVLSGMVVTVNTGPTPDEVTVGPGAFIQRGIIVEILSSQLVQVPDPTVFPLFLVAENANEVSTSNVDLLFTQTPNADSVIIAQWPTGPILQNFFPFRPEIPQKISNCSLADAISNINQFVIQRERQVAGGGQLVFIMPPGKDFVVGANKIWVFRNGKKLDISNDYIETNSTTITLNFGATAGDIFEFVVIKSAPPITSIALTDLTDVTGNLADAIKDVSVLRTPATAANPLATLADVVVTVGSGIPRILTKLVSASGTLTISPSTTYTQLPGSTFAVTVPAGPSVQVAFDVSLATFDAWSHSFGLHDAGGRAVLSLRDTGSLAIYTIADRYTLSDAHEGVVSGSDSGAGALMRRIITLAPGTYNFELVLNTPGGGSGGHLDYPLSVIVLNLGA